MATRNGDLTDTQVSELTIGLGIGSGPGFASPAEYRAAWWAHRAELLARDPNPFRRPEGYWDVEIEIITPGFPVSPYRNEREALLCLQLPLTEEEQRLLARAGEKGADGAL